MKRFSEAVIQHRRLIIWITVILCLISLFAIQFVKVNYDLTIYLPVRAPTVEALGVIKTALPNLQLYLPGLSVQEAISEKNNLSNLPGVEDILWLDNVTDLRDTPLEMLDPSLLEPYYQDGPLFQLTLKQARQSQTVPEIRALYPEGLLKGAAADHAQQVNVTMAQIASIMYYVIPLCLIILILATRHWVEPLLFVLVIGVAILFNEGSNVVLGSVSYITRACSAILQLAVSIDYAIFLLHRFSEYRDEGMEPVDAMKMAMRKASGAIAASATTTIFGFLALVLMDFTLGRDMGIVLAKGVLLSFLSVMIILPAVTVACAKWVDKTRHRRLLPSFKRLGNAVIRFGAPLAIVLLLAVPLAFLTQKQNTFIYGSGGMHSPDSPLRLESKAIDERFGKSRMLLLMVPEEDRAKEKRLSNALEEIPGIQSVLSYARTVSVEIPPQVLPDTVSGQFYSDGFARFILLSDREDEGPAAFEQVEQIRQVAASYYPLENHLLGASAVNYDLKTFITADNLKVLLAGIISIGVVLLLNFRSLSIPLILLLIIQGSIWLNMATPYIMGSPLNYIGYQIVSSVQLGATVDYGILLSQRYLEGRRRLKPKEAAAWALEVSAGSILPPAMILILAGYALGILVRDNRIISEMGTIIGRGAVLSSVMVLLVLPQVLAWCDRLIQKTTLKSRKADS